MSEFECPSCRTANEAGAVFCVSCGARLAPTASQPVPQPVPQPAPPYQAQAPGYQQPTVQPGYGAPGYPTGAPQMAGVDTGMVPAGFWIRFLAVLIDSVVLGVVSYVLNAVGMSTLGSILGIAYTIGFWATKGQTPGKMALGLYVVTASGEPIGWAKAITRYVGYLISALILAIGFIMIAFDDQKRGLHDRIAGTLVVKRV